MYEKIAIREKEYDGARIILWKNLNKYEENNTYNITVSKKGVTFFSVNCQDRKSLPDAISKFDSIIKFVEGLIEYGYNKQE